MDMDAKQTQFLSQFETNDIRLFRSCDGKDSALVYEGPSESEDRKYYRISIIDLQTLKHIGEVQFSLSFYGTKHVYLHNIMVYDKESLGGGYGAFANKFFLEKVWDFRFNSIEGKYYPKEPATREQVDTFYTRNGYSLPEPNDYDKFVSRYVEEKEIARIREVTTLSEEGYPTYPKLKDFEKKANPNLDRQA